MTEGESKPDNIEPATPSEKAEISAHNTTKASQEHLKELRRNVRSDALDVAKYSFLSGGLFGAAVTDFMLENSHRVPVAAALGVVAGIAAYTHYREFKTSTTRLEGETRRDALRQAENTPNERTDE